MKKFKCAHTPTITESQDNNIINRISSQGQFA